MRTTETFSVAEDAEFYWYDGIMNRPEEFSDLSSGDSVRLEFEDIEGEEALREIICQEEKQS